jgi:hypothetical protein
MIATQGFRLIRLSSTLWHGSPEASPLTSRPQFSYDLIDSVGISIVTARPARDADCA